LPKKEHLYIWKISSLTPRIQWVKEHQYTHENSRLSLTFPPLSMSGMMQDNTAVSTLGRGEFGQTLTKIPLEKPKNRSDFGQTLLSADTYNDKRPDLRSNSFTFSNLQKFIDRLQFI